MKIKRMLSFLVVSLVLLGTIPASAAVVTPDFYLTHKVVGQQSTAYNSIATDETANLTNYYVGLVAVHPLTVNGYARTPLIDFGTTLWLDSANITIQGTSYNHFTVEDTGDLNYAQHGNNSTGKYWIDIYFGVVNYAGDKTSPNGKAAWNYGSSNKVSYHWDEWIS